MIGSRPRTLHVLTALLTVAIVAFVTALIVEISSLRYQAGLDETSRLEASALLLSDRYIAAVQVGSPVAPLVRGTLPAGLRLTLLDAEGSGIADSQFDPRSIPSRMTDLEVKQAAVSGVGVATSYRIESGRRELTVCIAIRSQGSLVGFAVASSPTALMWQATSRTLSWALPALFVVGALWLLLAVVLARTVTRPLSDFADALEHRSFQSLAGFAMRADSTSLGRAQTAGYRLLQENEALSLQERSESSALSAVLDAIPQAVAILGSTGAVLSSNTHFGRFVGDEDSPLTGRHIAEIMTVPDFLAAIDRCVSEHQPQTVVAEDRGRYFSCAVHELDENASHERRTLIILEDVTDAVALPRIKADFITNASHELKTPLTAIRGYLDLLREEPENTHYLDIIERNVDRLIALSSDISLLSRLENRAPDIELVDVSELQRELAELFDRQARETGVALVFSVDGEGRFVYGDHLMLLQLLINLVENAYHFTQTGMVTVSSTADDTHVILSVSDTGHGIAAKDLPRIFERFYSRASDHGRPGTGLGLAIVKRIVLAHNGTIDVDSTINKGTTFIIHIPRNLGVHRPAATPEQLSDTKKEDL